MRVSKDIESLIPYKPGKPIAEVQREFGIKNVLKLASNENPLGVSPKVKEALKSSVDNLFRYPDPSCFALRNDLSKFWNIPSEQMLVGNGSNELIDLVIRVFCEPGESVIVPEKSFIAYGICAQAAHIGVTKLPLNADLTLNVESLIDHLETKRTSKERILFLANPNNPTGTYVGKDSLRRILQAAHKLDDFLVVVDEAYNEFVRAEDYVSAAEWISEFDNLMVSRTFSKVYGLAGLRVGVLIGKPELLSFVHRVRNPFNVNSLAQVAVSAAITDKEYLKKSQEIVWDGLDYFYTAFDEMGLKYLPSQGNFVLFDAARDAASFFKENLKKGLVLRPMGGYGMPEHLRISVGLAEQNQSAVNIMKSCLEL